MHEAIIIFIPEKKDGPAYETVVIDSSKKAIPAGSAHILNICPHLVKVMIGSKELEIQANESATVNGPIEVDDFNMAKVKCQYQENDTWRSTFEPALRFLESRRGLFVIHPDSNSQRPRLWNFME